MLQPQLLLETRSFFKNFVLIDDVLANNSISLGPRTRRTSTALNPQIQRGDYISS